MSNAVPQSNSGADARCAPEAEQASAAGWDLDSADFFADSELVAAPYEYFDAMRNECPVRAVAHPGVMAVTGYAEAVEVYRDAATFSSSNAVGGPFPPLHVSAGDEDISDLIEENRGNWPMAGFLVTMDGETHKSERTLLKRLMTPNRLRENEAGMSGIADLCIDSFLDDGACEFIMDYAKPFTTLVIADLLGVPADDREEFRAKLAGRRVGTVGKPEALEVSPLQYMYDKFTGYVESRRSEPQGDVITQLAQATYPDGTTPPVEAIVRLATFLFGAGQDTSARLISSALRILAQNKDLQGHLRGERGDIPTFLEEVLRLESPTMSDFRMARCPTTVGGVDVAAGTTIMIHPGAANRDDRQFDDPNEFQIDRYNVKEHIAFGRGAHSCPGGPLARAEGRVTIERFLDRTSDISLSEEHHGSEGAWRIDYEPTYIIRALSNLHLTFR